MSLNKGKGRRTKTKRVAIVSGLRTPFAKQLTTYRKQSSLDLGSLAVSEMMTRLNLSPAEVDQVVFGQVMPSLEAPNIAREIVLSTGMDPKTEAFSVSRACATSFQAAISVAEAIHADAIKVGVAGGADSASVVPITISPKLSEALVALSKAKTLPQRLNILKKVRPKDLLPVPPSPKEFSTGLTMGQHGEQMAKKHGITREAQDAFAHRSHTLAAKAWESGKLDDEVLSAYVAPFDAPLNRDNVVRFDSNVEGYAKLRPAFDKKHGTLTAGNSSPLTDGAAAVLIMREDKAKALGYEPLGFIRSYAFAALDPKDDMLMGPTHSTPLALKRGGVTLEDMDLIDMHEAFAAQILCNVKAFASDTYCKDVLGLSSAIGEIDMDKFNVNGGSIAFGHPFAATGARMITQTLRELNRRGGGLALTTACAAGGLGVAMVLEGA